jgi:hypothetical protein
MLRGSRLCARKDRIRRAGLGASQVRTSRLHEEAQDIGRTAAAVLLMSLFALGGSTGVGSTSSRQTEQGVGRCLTMIGWVAKTWAGSLAERERPSCEVLLKPRHRHHLLPRITMTAFCSDKHPLPSLRLSINP